MGTTAACQWEKQSFYELLICFDAKLVLSFANDVTLFKVVDKEQALVMAINVISMMIQVQVIAQAPSRYARDPRSPNERLRLEAMQEQQPGYGSDGSETLSVHSVQSIPTR